MRKTLSVSSLAAIAGLALAGSVFAQTPPPAGGAGGAAGAQKLSQAECEAVWNKAAGSGAATSLSQVQAQAHVKNFASIDQNNDGQLSRTEFNQGCDKGLVQSTAATGAGSGASGAGSPPGSTQKK